ncbi:MAG TPA: MFS transporter [Deltaproteobacteria bacterium]|nr:MFS transporter [Deltaproteobacteria bacterium]
MPVRILWLLSAISFVVLLGVGIVVPLLPVYARSLGATATQVGLIFTCFSLSRTVFTPIMGMIAEKRDLRKLILTGLFLYAGIALMYILAGTPEALIVIRTFHGMASACVLPLAMSYIALVAEKGKEGAFMGSFNTALFLGMGAGPLLGGVITEAMGIDGAFLCLSLLSLLAGILVFFLVPSMRSSVQGRPAFSVRAISRYSPMTGLLIFRVISALGRGSLFAFIPLLAARAGLSMLEVGMLISANIFTTGLLQRPFGQIVTKGNLLKLITIGSLVSAAALASMPLGQCFRSFLAIGLIMGIGGAVSIPASSVMAVEYGKKLGMTSSLGIFDAAWGIGMILGPVLMGVVSDLGGLDSAFYAGGLVTAAGTGIFLLISRKAGSGFAQGDSLV